MLPLAEQQARMAAWLGDPAAEPSTDLGLTPSRHAAIHRNNFFFTLSEGLAAVFPAVARLVGPEFFAATAREFVRLSPPVSPVLIDYGDDFADFLAGFPPAAGLPYLADVARLEWAWHRAYHAGDVEPLAIANLLSVGEDELPAMRLSLHPTRWLLRSRWPVAEIWDANRDDRDRQAEVELHETDCRLLVVRPRDEVKVLTLEPACFDFARALDDGYSLGEAVFLTAESWPGFDIGAALRLLAGAEAFAAMMAPDGGQGRAAE